MKNILIYSAAKPNIHWSKVNLNHIQKPLTRYSDPKERASFVYLLNELKTKFSKIYLKLDSQKSFADGHFKNVFFWEGGENFELVKELTQIDLVLDRSGELNFPMFATKVCNGYEFKSLAKDKYLSYLFLKEFCPKTFLIQEGVEDKIPEIIDLQKIILKPRSMSGGKGIQVLELKGSLEDKKAFVKGLIEKYPNYLIQEFKETDGGVPGVIEGRHDIRVQVCDTKISFIYIRVPEENQYLANVSQGGNVAKYVKIEDFDESVGGKIKAIIKTISTKFPNSHYSIDFGIAANSDFFLYEINSNMGWPDYDEAIKPWAKDLAEMLYKMA